MVINIGNIINLSLVISKFQLGPIIIKYVSMEKSFSFNLHYFTAYLKVGSISAALSFLVCPSPSEENAGSFPEQRLVIEPNLKEVFLFHKVLLNSLNINSAKHTAIRNI